MKMKNKKIVIIGLVTILVIGIISAFAMGTEDKSWFGHKGLKSSEKHFNKNLGDKSFWLEKLGLPADATKTQIQEALKEKWEEGKTGYHNKIREKLGLPENASEEEIQEALQKWREENKNKFGHKRHRFHKGVGGNGI